MVKKGDRVSALALEKGEEERLKTEL